MGCPPSRHGRLCCGQLRLYHRSGAGCHQALPPSSCSWCPQGPPPGPCHCCYLGLNNKGFLHTPALPLPGLGKGPSLALALGGSGDWGSW